MYRWLEGPGNVFRHPLPNSTNYINAYDQSGALIRADESKRNEKNDEEDVAELGESEQSKGNEEGDEDAAPKRKYGASGPATGDVGIPKETADDLMPYPLNRHFRSQPVLSEELREEIYKRVMVDGQDIRTVSATLSVEMRRVGAVVRLKAVEKQWESEVSCNFPLCPRGFLLPYDETTLRLVLKTFTMVTIQITTL